MVFWANKAARQKFGRPRQIAEVLEWWDALSDKYKPAAQATLKTINELVQVTLMDR